MAPDRGSARYQAISSEDGRSSNEQDETPEDQPSEQGHSYEQPTVPPPTRRRSSEAREFLADQASQAQNFTLRGVLVGLAIGVIICFSNTYFGLQTGWVSGMAMPSALIGFAYFKSVAQFISYPFTPVENVLVTTVAGAVGTMPLGCGFVGVMPALNYLLNPEENGPLVLGTGKLIIWALGICFFGVVIAVPLRKQVLIREKLKFPSGTATALIIGVLHGNQRGGREGRSVESGKKQPDYLDIFRRQQSQDMRRSSSGISPVHSGNSGDEAFSEPDEQGGLSDTDHRNDWKGKIKLLLTAFAISAVYVGKISTTPTQTETFKNSIPNVS